MDTILKFCKFIFSQFSILKIIIVMGLLSSFQFSFSQKSACNLLQPFELEAVLKGKATGFTNKVLSSSHTCTGKVGIFAVTIRMADRQDETGEKEKKGIELLRKQGWTIDVKKNGDLTLSTALPPAKLSDLGFNTTASIFRGGKVVAVEVTAPSKEKMASVDLVSTLVQKAYSRLKQE